MRLSRMLLSSVGGVALLGGANACGVASANAGGAWVEVSPATTAAGQQVAVRADCGDTSNTASVTSKAFGTVTLRLAHPLLVADVTVPASTRAGTFEVTLNCRSGATATTTVTVHVERDRPATMGPHTGGGYLADGGGFSDAMAWLVGGGTAMAAAGIVGVVSKRRRSRATASR